MRANILTCIILFLSSLQANEYKSASANSARQSNTKHYHWANSIINFGELVELEDGSKWSIAKTEVYKVSTWRALDTIFISPSSWFSSHKYCLTNQTAKSSVEADFYHGPVPFGPFTHWVVALDKYSGHVFLEDGSSWTVAYDDWKLFDKWLINDFVIIGCDDSWFSSYEYILINIHAEHHISVNPF